MLGIGLGELRDVVRDGPRPILDEFLVAAEKKALEGRLHGRLRGLAWAFPMTDRSKRRAGFLGALQRVRRQLQQLSHILEENPSDSALQERDLRRLNVYFSAE